MISESFDDIYCDEALPVSRSDITSAILLLIETILLLFCITCHWHVAGQSSISYYLSE